MTAGGAARKVNAARWVLFMAHLKCAPQRLESRASLPSGSEGWGTLKFKGPRRKDGAPARGLRSIQEVGIFELGGLVIASIFSIEIECRPPRSKSLPLTFTYLPA